MIRQLTSTFSIRNGLKNSLMIIGKMVGKIKRSTTTFMELSIFMLTILLGKNLTGKNYL